ncbi:hypothetical protein B0H63DRAFT_529143 [Podospora didyma]|uniref:Xylanolytic transcriptional activator regulatory domain-containing protein n=1 Tax=Podospora didyma TaxID=330526 RepID=A0AAE0K3J3_9PEZI|nr:hypothetical protein B0H63DRAFT_529143 [Podospora didyma]
MDHNVIVLPPAEYADHLWPWYWLHVHSVFPVLHRPTFEAEHRQIWNPTSKHPHRKEPGFHEIVFHATLNIMLALCCQRDDSSLAVVQLLLLRGLHLYFATRANRCWVMIGAAIRVSFSMGLPVAAFKGAATQLDREMRKRVWYGGCVTLDQIVSMAFGRPILISKELMSHAPLP